MAGMNGDIVMFVPLFVHDILSINVSGFKYQFTNCMHIKSTMTYSFTELVLFPCMFCAYIYIVHDQYLARVSDVKSSK